METSVARPRVAPNRMNVPVVAHAAGDEPDKRITTGNHPKYDKRAELAGRADVAVLDRSFRAGAEFAIPPASTGREGRRRRRERDLARPHRPA